MGPGALSVCLFLPSSWSGSLVPRLWKGIPPTPLLLIARPSRLLRGSGGWLVGRRGAVGISFPPLVGRLVPLSPAGVLLLFSLCCLLVFVLCFDNLRVLLARVVCLFVCFSFCLSLLYARPWLLIRELVVRLLAFLSTRGPASCLCSVLLCRSFLFLWRCGVLFSCFVSFFACVCSVELSVCCVGCAWGFSFLLRVCLMP